MFIFKQCILEIYFSHFWGLVFWGLFSEEISIFA